MRIIQLSIIEKYLSRHKNPVVAFSGGKDSLVIWDLVRQVYPDIPCVFNNTKVERPETLRFKRLLVEQHGMNLVEVKPLNNWTFWRIVEEYGFPIGQRRGASATTRCCYHLKKAPMKSAMKEHQWDLVIDGMTIWESRQRLLTLNKYIDTFGYRYHKSWDCHKLSPILDWTPSDVWDYIEAKDLPYNRYYDNEMPDIPEMTKRGIRQQGYHRCLRVGCWSCTIPLKHNRYYLTHLRMFYPKLHHLLLKKGLAKFLLENGKDVEIYKRLGANWIAEHRPCYFDGITV